MSENKTTVVEAVSSELIGKTPAWRVLTRFEDGDGNTHVFPHSIFEIVAGQYGIDPDDIETILDIVIHIPFQNLDVDTEHGRMMAALPDVYQVHNTNEAKETISTLTNSASRRVDVRSCKALDVIRKAHNPDKTRIKEIAKDTDIGRWELKYGAIDVEPPEVSPSPKGFSHSSMTYEKWQQLRAKEVQEESGRTPSDV